MRTAVVVLNWNNPDDTLACLDSVYRSHAEDFGIIVVDNGSSDHSVPKLKAWMDTVSNGSTPASTSTADGDLHSIVRSGSDCSYLALLERRSNDGYAAGNGAGIRLARRLGSSHVWILNNDTVVEPGALRALHNCADSSDGIAVAGAVIFDLDHPDRLQCFGGGRVNLATTRSTLVGAGLRGDAVDQLAASSPRIDYISGASMYCSLDALAAVNDLSPAYFLFFEDFECCFRLRRLGYRLVVDPAARIYHRRGASSGSSVDLSQRSPLAAFHATRSAIIFYRRNHLELAPWAVFVRCLFGLRLLLQRSSVGTAVLRGVVSGLRSGHLQCAPINTR